MSQTELISKKYALQYEWDVVSSFSSNNFAFNSYLSRQAFRFSICQIHYAYQHRQRPYTIKYKQEGAN